MTPPSGENLGVLDYHLNAINREYGIRGKRVLHYE